MNICSAVTKSIPEAVRTVKVCDGYTNGGTDTDRSARVVHRLMAGTVPIVLRGGLEHIEVHHFPWAHLQNAGRVSTPVTVIWCRPHRRQMAIKQGRVAFHAELMSAEDMRHPIRLKEFVDHPRSKRITRASVRTV